MRLTTAVILLLCCLRAFAGDIAVQAGMSTSNAWVGGMIYYNFSSLTNCCAGGTTTNLAPMLSAGGMLTNNGDTLEFVATGRFSLTGQSKRLIVNYGSQALLDSGLQAVSNGAWRIDGFITRVGPESQYYQASLRWDRGVMGGGTNSSGRLVQTNWLGMILQVQGAANVVSSITNEMFWARYWQAPH